MKHILFSFILTFFFLGCSQQHTEKKLIIATNSWIGYTPLFYAQAKGDLEKLNIDLSISVSLAEATNIYAMGQADMVTTTQHEYFSLRTITKNIFPFILIDKSYGGDMVLSNKTLDELHHAKKIDAYLEIDSINAEIIQKFLAYYDLNSSKVTFINKDQEKIQALSNNKSKAILITTYSPYDVILLQKGFFELISTKDENLLVLDILCGKKELLMQEKKRMIKLKKIIDKAIQEIDNNPKVSYNYVKPYLNNISYEEYTKALKNIRWINNPNTELLQKVKELNINTKYILQ